MLKDKDELIGRLWGGLGSELGGREWEEELDKGLGDGVDWMYDGWVNKK